MPELAAAAPSVVYAGTKSRTLSDTLKRLAEPLKGWSRAATAYVPVPLRLKPTLRERSMGRGAPVIVTDAGSAGATPAERPPQ
jgi:hypothetical protein